MNLRSILVRLSLIAAVSWAAPARAAEVTCWFPPKFSAETAKRITDTLSGPGITVLPRIAQSYPELLEAFATKGSNLAYVGSFAQAILAVKKQGVPLVQAIDGKEFYGSWMIYPRGADPEAILRDSPTEIAFAKGASSGESGAKAATGGKASLAKASHDAAAEAVKAGKARAAFVKSWWWEANKARFPELALHRVPGISDARHPDNVLTASRSLDPALRAKLQATALASPAAFNARSMRAFDGDLSFTVMLMRKGRIDPAAYLFE
jgi:ABC-type phosphate/phosphonate transport system substrate-binding protein